MTHRTARQDDTNGYPTQFALGTTGILVKVKIKVDQQGMRLIDEVVYSKLPIFVGDAPVIGTEKQVERVWESEPIFLRTGRSLRDEIERVTQAVYPE